MKTLLRSLPLCPLLSPPITTAYWVRALMSDLRRAG